MLRGIVYLRQFSKSSNTVKIEYDTSESFMVLKVFYLQDKWWRRQREKCAEIFALLIHSSNGHIGPDWFQRG